jgi:hypothetical protein
MLKMGIAKCEFQLDNSRPFYKAAVIIILISAATIPFTLIGSLSVLACFIALIALRFVHKVREIGPATFI